MSPTIGAAHLGAIDTSMVRQWRSDLLRAGVSESMAAKAYRLLRAVLMTAATEDKMIPRNPCQIRSAGLENPEERPVLSLAEMFGLANRMKHPRYRVACLSVRRTASISQLSSIGEILTSAGKNWLALSLEFIQKRMLS